MHIGAAQALSGNVESAALPGAAALCLVILGMDTTHPYIAPERCQHQSVADFHTAGENGACHY